MQQPLNKTDRLSSYLIYSAAISFILFYLILAFYNRPVADDLYFIEQVKGKNLLEVLIALYTTVSGRWAAWVYFYAVVSFSNSFQNISDYIFIYYSFTLVIFIYAVNAIIKAGIRKLFNVDVERRTSISYSVLFIACFFFFTFQNIETWWYLCASFHYLQGIVFLLLGVALLLREKKNLIHYVFISISFIYVGACYEIYFLIVCSLLHAGMIYFLRNKESRLLFLENKSFFNGLIVALISLVVAACILFLAEGNIERRAYFKAHYNEFYSPLSLNVVINIFTEKKYLIAVLLASVWLLLGAKLRSSTILNVNKRLLKKIFLFSFLALIFSVLIVYFFSLLFTYRIVPPARAWTFTSLLLTFLICFAFFVIGYFFSISHPRLLMFSKFFLPLAILVVLACNLYRQNKLVSIHAKKYDQLITTLLNAKHNGFNGIFYTEKLPDSGLLMQLNLNEETPAPKMLKAILELDFEIEVKM